MTRTALRASLAVWERRLAYRRRTLAHHRAAAHGHHGVSDAEAWRIHKWEHLVAEAQALVATRRRQLAPKLNLGERALHVARGQLGVMETGGNNRGLPLTRFIRANGGAGPEPWCGDFVAYCFRLGGSSVVQRGWAAVRLLGHLTGMRIVRDPRPGDIVCFTFDHTGIFESRLPDGRIQTIEGNTGASGAVSDSATGGDGVYRKRRPQSLVARYVRVTR